ncbi:MAG TPA: prepilin-type N-terminal cleavage/methylation domain-containing protein [Stenotrophomonas sp.]|jgi:prepilin-type N-terminal cleavage/methylation domain-containing protein
MRNGESPRIARGFSLIELIVVVAIIAVLLVIALPRYEASLDRARDVALQTSLKTMRESIDRFHEDKDRYPQSLQDLVDQHYLRSVPIDPITGLATSWQLELARIEGPTGVAGVRSGAEGRAQDGRPYSDL